MIQTQNKNETTAEVIDSTVIPIENLRIWTGGNWMKCAVKPNLLLRIHYDQLLITSEDKVLESYNTSKKLKGIFKDDILILIVNANGQEVRKIKFQVRENLFQCLQELKARFPVVSYGSMTSKCKVTTKYDNLEDIFKRVLEDKATLNTLPMPDNYSSFVKLCLLDPMFPQLVQHTKQLLDTEILNKDSSV